MLGVSKIHNVMKVFATIQIGMFLIITEKVPFSETYSPL